MVDTMTPNSRNATGTAWPRIVILLAVAATGCSSTTMQNMKTERDLGFNGYLNTLATNCRPLVIGPYDVGSWLEMRGSDSQNYSYFLSVTSRLYYGTMTRDEYRDGLNSFLGPGSANAQAYACIFANLPAQRPTGGTGGSVGGVRGVGM
jgi:hypothetical protein